MKLLHSLHLLLSAEDLVSVSESALISSGAFVKVVIYLSKNHNTIILFANSHQCEATFLSVQNIQHCTVKLCGIDCIIKDSI